jgi:[acyl-carrier-protein] S-malonyltransferase
MITGVTDMAGTLILFPGQGSQAVGMAEHLWEYPVARAAFAEATEVLGWDIGGLCRHGSMEELTRTDRTQLAVLTCSVATWRVLEEAGVGFARAAGHSLGEYSALVAAGNLSFADALHVVEARGRAMQVCADERGGTMAAVIGLDTEAVEQACASAGEVWVANYNSPGQIVISGSVEGVRAAGEAATAAGAKRVIPLQVAGAFHTPLMAGAAKALSQALSEVTFVPGTGTFFSTTEVRTPEAGELAEIMARQLMSPVRFSQSMEALLQDQDPPAAALEVGPGNVLSGLLRRIARDMPAVSTGDGESLRSALEGHRAGGGAR